MLTHTILDIERFCADYTFPLGIVCTQANVVVAAGGKLQKICTARRQNRLRFVYTHFKSCDQSFDKTYFDFSDKFHAMQNCAMNTKSSIVPKLRMGMVI